MEDSYLGVWTCFYSFYLVNNHAVVLVILYASNPRTQKGYLVQNYVKKSSVSIYYFWSFAVVLSQAVLEQSSLSLNTIGCNKEYEYT